MGLQTDFAFFDAVILEIFGEDGDVALGDQGVFGQAQRGAGGHDAVISSRPRFLRRSRDRATHRVPLRNLKGPGLAAFLEGEGGVIAQDFEYFGGGGGIGDGELGFFAGF